MSGLQNEKEVNLSMKKRMLSFLLVIVSMTMIVAPACAAEAVPIKAQNALPLQRADVGIGPYKAQKAAHPSTSIRQIFTALQFTNAEIVMPARRAFGLWSV